MELTQKKLTSLAGLVLKQLKNLAFNEVSDPRQEKNKRWSLQTFLGSVLVGIVAGSQSLKELEGLTAHLHPSIKRKLGLTKSLPRTTARDLLVKLDPHEIRGSLHSHCKSVIQAGLISRQVFPFGIVSIDGKSTRVGATEGPYVQTKTLKNDQVEGYIRTMTCSLISSPSTLCLDANPIPAATNEMGHFQETVKDLLQAYAGLDLFRLIRADAGVCSRENAAFLNANQLNYCFEIKNDNWKLMQGVLSELQELELDQAEGCSTDDLGDKTTVDRFLFKTESLAGQFGFESMKTVLRVQRIKHNNETCEAETIEDAYFISDLAWESLTVNQWLDLVRQHWHVENKTHWTLDAILEEDKHPWITKSAIGFLVILILRRIGLNLLSLLRWGVSQSQTKQLSWKLTVLLCVGSLIDLSRIIALLWSGFGGRLFLLL